MDAGEGRWSVKVSGTHSPAPGDASRNEEEGRWSVDVSGTHSAAPGDGAGLVLSCSR